MEDQVPFDCSATAFGRFSEAEEAFYATENSPSSFQRDNKEFRSHAFESSRKGGSTVNLHSCDDPLVDARSVRGHVSLAQGGIASIDPRNVKKGNCDSITLSGEISGLIGDNKNVRALTTADLPKVNTTGKNPSFLNNSIACVTGTPSSGLMSRVQQFQSIGVSLKIKVDSQTKSWPYFMSLSSFDRPPNTAVLIADRVDRNVRYFFFNYVIIVCTIVLAYLLTSPVTLLSLCIAGILSLYVSTQGDNVQISSTTQIPAKQAQFCIGVAASFCLIFCSQFLFAAAGSGLIIILLHACLHTGKSYEEIQAETVQDNFA